LFISPAEEDALSIQPDLSEDRVPHILTETWVVPPHRFDHVAETGACTRTCDFDKVIGERELPLR
ncbi:MAG: hypothetical protein ACKOFU_04095, partial [Actinomycetota bacterium]